MADYLPTPDTFNGKPTRYVLFDGFTQASGGGKLLYVAGALLSPLVFFIPIVPLVMEGLAYNTARHNRMDAEQYVQQQVAMAAASGALSNSGLSQSPDLNPNARQGFRAAEEARRMAPPQVGLPRQ